MSQQEWVRNKTPLLKEIKEAIREAESLLVSGEYKKIGSESDRGRILASSIEARLADYEGTVTTAPQEAYDVIEPISVLDSETPKWFVDFDLWIDGKQSDLTLSLSIESGENGRLTAFVDNLHTL